MAAARLNINPEAEQLPAYLTGGFIKRGFIILQLVPCLDQLTLESRVTVVWDNDRM
jgi:hypothetical protein